MATIYDIAKETGLSASTVARALSGNGYCSERTRTIVLETAQKIGYAPNQAAKTLKNSITKKIMLCIPDIMNPYYFQLIDGVTRALDKEGYNILLSYTMHNPKKELEILNTLKSGFVDGLIFGSFDYNKELISAIEDTNLPTVITSYYPSNFSDNFDCVYVDQPKAAYIATRHCISNGHKKIVFIGGNPNEQNTIERFNGYKAAIDKFGCHFDKEYVLSADFTRDGASKVFSNFLDKKLPFSAIVACNDLMGIGCFSASREHGLSVPRDVSIVSLDNTDYCLCSNPGLTSVDMKQGDVGFEAAQFILDRILNKRQSSKNMCFSPNLVIRHSVSKIIDK